MLDNARMARRLEHREMAFEIAVLIGEGIFETVAHACLRGEVDDPADAVRFHKLADQPGAGDVAVDQPEIEMIGKQRRARFLQRDVILVGEAVEPDTAPNREGGVEGKGVALRGDSGGRGVYTKKKQQN